MEKWKRRGFNLGLEETLSQAKMYSEFVSAGCAVSAVKVMSWLAEMGRGFNKVAQQACRKLENRMR